MAARPVRRVRDRASFVALRTAGRRSRCGAVSVTWVADPAAGPPRVAFAIGRAVGGAVVRNRLRRRLRAVMDELAPRLAPGTYLVGAGPDAARLSFEALRTAVSGALDGLPAPEAAGR